MSENFYVEVPSIPLDSEIVKKSESRAPFNKNIGARGSVKGEDVDNISNETTTEGLMYIENNNSGRTLTEKSTSTKVVFGGEFKCDIFGARDVKGVRHEYPSLTFIEQSGYEYFIRAEGLYTSEDLDYEIKASRFMRENGLPTENIVQVVRLEEISINGEPWPIDVWKEWALSDFIERHKGQDEKIKEAEDLLKKDFYVMERELQTSERIRDIAVCKDKEDFENIIENVFSWVNVATSYKGEGIIPGTKKPEAFDFENDADIERYFTEWLPQQMGIYLARMKKLNISNYYPHGQNWSAVGTLYDMEDIVGEAIGYPCTEEDHQHAIRSSLGVLNELLDSNNYLSELLGNSLNKAKSSLIKSYVEELGIDVNELGYEYFADNSFHNGKELIATFITAEDWQDISNQAGLKLTDSPEKLKEKEKKIEADVKIKKVEVITGKEITDRII